MGKNTKKKNKKTAKPKISIQELSISRSSGQNALRGYSYQFLYSCYLILSSSNPNTSFQLEGIEDIDCIEKKAEGNAVTHIQLKYSVNRQDASFLSDVLKNFLEAYLLDPNRCFKLVYDFSVAKGNLSRLFSSNLDDKTRTYWVGVIENIRQSNPSWNWSLYDFDAFISCLSFEKVEKVTLEAEIEKALIGTYEITTDNVALFANSIKVLCFEKMEHRDYITKGELDARIQSVKIDISKGPQNPAHSWIRKLDYSRKDLVENNSFYEGKKATPADIAEELPVRRPALEKAVIDSIHENAVTVIKSSSGQGKTTLALQVAYLLQNEYKPYQLLWCDDIKETGNIVQYFKTRIQLGEQILILLDNLDSHLRQWNHLAQLLQSELPCHYKLIITSRENDWYDYSGDVSNVRSMKIIKPVLKEKEAQEIFERFREAGRIFPGITNWQNAWNKIAEKQLLIEYVYLLTHGEMLSERIASQMTEIGQSSSGRAKCEILRKVCFADVCGIRLCATSLFASQTENAGFDYGELLHSMDSEFLVQFDAESGYIEGLHPIRSRHVVERLHTFFPIEATALSVIAITQKEDLSVLFSHLPEFDLNKDSFWGGVIEKLWNENDLSNYICAIQGLFSGSVWQYYLSCQAVFDDANAHGGLPLLLTEVCPFVSFKEFNLTVKTLENLEKSFPENKNIKYLCELRDRTPVCDLQKTFIYAFCNHLYAKLLPLGFSEIKDTISYAAILDWIYNIDPKFNMAVNISLDALWQHPGKLTLECVSTLMYLSYCGNRDVYMDFVGKNLRVILIYLKHATKSHRMTIDQSKKAIHVEYILQLHGSKTENEQSVSRLKYICRTLPVFDYYCSDALRPTVDRLSAYAIHDDAHKEMPLKNIVITFHQNLASLWNKTIMSNYEFDTVSEWLNHWFHVRESICLLADKCCACIYKLLSGKKLDALAADTDCLRHEFIRAITGEKLYPKEDRPFEEKATVPQGLKEIEQNYFQSMRNFTEQFPQFLTSKQMLATINLSAAHSALAAMQEYFADISKNLDLMKRHLTLCTQEAQNIERLTMCCSYYQTHEPNKYFNKYQIKDWYSSHFRDEMKTAENGLAQSCAGYSLEFPNQIYKIGIARCYPIVASGLSRTSESSLAELFYGCIPFTDTSFDYLVVLFTNEQGEIEPTALQIPRRMFETFTKGKATDEVDLLSLTDKLALPYPVDVTPQMLACFTKRFGLRASDVHDVDTPPIGDIAEKLWDYSKCVELLTEPEDADYLAAETQVLRVDIEEMLCSLKDNLPNQEIDWLTGICKSVFAGSQFDDVLFNHVIEHVIDKSLEA